MKQTNSCLWMDKLVKKYGVKLAIIYEDWFPCTPNNWIKIAELHLGKKKITPARKKVDFFLTVTRKDDVETALSKLKAFSKTLPEGVKLVIFKENIRPKSHQE